MSFLFRIDGVFVASRFAVLEGVVLDGIVEKDTPAYADLNSGRLEVLVRGPTFVRPRAGNEETPGISLNIDKPAFDATLLVGHLLKSR